MFCSDGIVSDDNRSTYEHAEGNETAASNTSVVTQPPDMPVDSAAGKYLHYLSTYTYCVSMKGQVRKRCTYFIVLHLFLLC